jgi:hypothetical protein
VIRKRQVGSWANCCIALFSEHRKNSAAKLFKPTLINISGGGGVVVVVEVEVCW